MLGAGPRKGPDINRMVSDPILPRHPEHKHNALYDHIAEQVRTAAPDRPSAKRANLTAGLLDAYLRNQPNPELRIDETRIRDLRVVVGNPDAATPSWFLVSASQSQSPAVERISVSLAYADVPASQTLARYGQERSVGADGYLTDPGITRTPIPGLQRAPLDDVNAIVLHTLPAAQQTARSVTGARPPDPVEPTSSLTRTAASSRRPVWSVIPTTLAPYSPGARTKAR